MSILSNKSKGAVGALALYGSIQKSSGLASRNETGPWSSAWESRGSAFPFMCAPGSHQDIVFLEDLQPMVVHKLATSWASGPKGSWARHDYARSLKYTGGINSSGELEETGVEDIFADALGRAPQFVYVARILNMTPYVYKQSGETIPWRVQPLILDHIGTIEHLRALSDAQGRDMKGARIKISRSTNKQSARIGDSWIPNGYIEDDELAKAVADGELAGLPDKLAEINLIEGYPTYTVDEAKSILRLHRKLVDKHGTGSGGWFNYDASGMAAAIGEPAEAAKPEGEAQFRTGSATGSILSGGGGLLSSKPSEGLDGLPDVADEPTGSAAPDLLDPFKA
jgi:hypothetical protein